MMRGAALVLSAVLAATSASAATPDGSVRPKARVLTAPTEIPTKRPQARPLAQATTSQNSVRPQPRPVSEQIVAMSSRSTPLAPLVDTSARPYLRPPDIFQRAMAKRRQARRGMVCGDIQIQGETIGQVPGRISGCGIEDAVRIRSVSGVSLSQNALMDCNTAKALNRWVSNGVKPALSPKGRVSELKVAAHYICRTRNNQPGARISEHGKGRAIDISGFVMDDGEVITVLNHWNAKGYRRALRRVHKTACGPFGTVLGPASDRFHRDHFHFDTAQYRSGPFCR